ncbi:MAG: glycosyl hydrolase family 18 protein [Thermoanaerobacterales bacterium]|nr:glycosyl hydrolase family 18 protein [Bacillota bacterium]MDI6908036.1 glycosyl hydrolase family 18 protein [Thermoanaerobacterales bacterium]
MLFPLGPALAAPYGSAEGATTPQRVIEVNAYILPGTGTDKYLAEAADHLTWVSVFSYRAGPDGELIAPPGAEEIVDAAWKRGVWPQMVVTNFDGGNFNTALGHALVTDPEKRARLIGNIQRTLDEKGFYGLNIDFENLPPADRYAYTAFIAEVAAAVRPSGHPLSIAVAPKASDRPGESWVGFVDYAALGRLVDRMIVMTYEWGWIGGPPMPIAPLDKVREVLAYVTRFVPPEKVLMGVPLYGYDWQLPDTPWNTARGLDNARAKKLAARYGARILWDQRAASPYFYYTDEWGFTHMVWFEDGWSVAAKYALVREFGLAGVSYWVLGNEFPDNWSVLDGLFDPRRDPATGWDIRL